MKKIILITMAVGLFASCKKDSGCATCERTYYIYDGTGTFTGPGSINTNQSTKPTDKVRMCGYSSSKIDSLNTYKPSTYGSSNIGDTVFTKFQCQL